MIRDVRQILSFWFAPESKPYWFKRSADFDAELTRLFLAAHERAADGRLADWQNAPESALALILLLDQFPRNMFRGTARAFATDPQARAVADWAVDRDFDLTFPDDERRIFFYLPFEHSEAMDDQLRCVELVKTRIRSDEFFKYALKHLEVIGQFGRFPHRNAILGRDSTPDEAEYLKRPDAGF